jgi:hypothetical protein
MLRRSIFLAVPLLLAGVLASNMSLAGGKKPEGKAEDRKAAPGAQAIMNIAAAYQMADYGRKNKAPEALLAAARVIGTTATAKGKANPKDKVNKELEVDDVKEAMAMIDEALKMSKSPAIATLAKETRKLIQDDTRSPFGGTFSRSSFFRGDGVDISDTYHVDLRGKEETCISVTAYGPPGLDVDVELIDDETNQVVARDTSVGPNSFIRYYVPRSGTYRVRVFNHTQNTPCDRYILRVY